MKYLSAKMAIYSLYSLSLLWLLFGIILTSIYIKDRSQLSSFHLAYQALCYFNAVLMFPFRIDANRLPLVQIIFKLTVCAVSILIIERYQ
ncbi:hypothetical protein [Chamaesiphon polymorphus]|uniref:Uncharacterized protein n=1 Tax=Chamaesiphon polymorphus CCALA 037 TaxID=2107692 RepID=A0A2T1FRQ3_9CYAN|nr:hypothetical protein [Chamaesiphon polymorphus]PSB47631.1 hypothetical protein C7B77_24235 [Chamaesiphon polymorphus CCALA 037]